MKVLIAADMEGISGVVDWDHVTAGHSEYERYRKFMTADVNAAVDGVAKAGILDIVVSDGHAMGNNILLEELDPRARLNCGTGSPLSMVQGVDNGVDAAVFIGYHARMGTPDAILDHTWSSSKVANVWLNETLVGEIGMNASVCGHFGVPVVMISGDQNACAEAKKWIPKINTSIVKRASSRSSAECLALDVSRQMIRQTVEYALNKFKDDGIPEALVPETPTKISIEFKDSHFADRVALLPGVVRVGGRRIDLVAEDMLTAYQVFRAAVSIA